MADTLKANCSEFTLIFICFQKVQLMRNRKHHIKICFQYQENVLLNPSYIQNTSDWLLKYIIGLFCVKQELYYEFAAHYVFA